MDQFINDVGISIIALGIVLEVLFKDKTFRFGDIHIMDNITGIITALSTQGLVGLVAIWILYHIYNKK